MGGYLPATAADRLCAYGSVKRLALGSLRGASLLNCGYAYPGCRLPPVDGFACQLRLYLVCHYALYTGSRSGDVLIAKYLVGHEQCTCGSTRGSLWDESNVPELGVSSKYW